MSSIWHYFRDGTHPISILSLLTSGVALVISFINSRRGRFDLLVKKFDLVSPVYKDTGEKLEKNKIEFNRVLNLTRQFFVLALNPNHINHSDGDYSLRQFNHLSYQYEIWINPKLPDGAQKLINKINEKFEEGMNSLINAAYKYQGGALKDEDYLERNTEWSHISLQLQILISQYYLFCSTALNELTNGIRGRSRLSKTNRLKLD